MHKYFLTRQECEIIQNSEAIINEIGEFPSMENGSLINIDISPSPSKEFRALVALTFDIEVWLRCTEHTERIRRPQNTKIRLLFDGVFDFHMSRFALGPGCGEIKFGDGTRMYQDSVPGETIDVPRPYCTFYARNGSDLMLEFSEDECTISTEFVED